MKLRNIFEGSADEIDITAHLGAVDKVWAQKLSSFPEQLQKEIAEERPNPDQEDVNWIQGIKLAKNQPISVPMKSLIPKNVGAISRTPKEVIDVINKRWGLKVPAGKVYDPNPNRYFKYAKMSAKTSKPSVAVNGEIFFGVGRFIAALLRGDQTLQVWDLRQK